MHHGGLPGSGLDLDRPPVPLCAPPHAGRDSGPGGGEYPSPIMPPMRHVRSLVGLERPEPSYGHVHQGHMKEVQAVDRG